MAVNEKVCHWWGMAREDLHFRLRIPEDLKNRVEKSATDNHRSMTAEIVARLQRSFEVDDFVPPDDDITNIAIKQSEKIVKSMREQNTIMKAVLEQNRGLSELVKAIASTDGKISDQGIKSLRALIATQGKGDILAADEHEE